MRNQKEAYIYGVVAVLLWSTVASAFKVSLRYVGVFQLLFYSSLTSVILLFIILLFQKKLKYLRKLSVKQFITSAILGFLNPFLYYIVLFRAYSLLRAQEALTLNYTWPIVLALLSIPLLKQKIGFKSIVAIIISFMGAFVIATGGDILGLNFTNVLGVVLALGSTVIWSFFWIFNVRDKRDEVVKLFLNFAFGFIYILILVVVFSKLLVPVAPGIIGVVYVGIFEMGITFILWLKALQMSKTTAKVANLIYLSPFISLIIINLVVGEKIVLSTIIGLVLIIGGIVIQESSFRFRPLVSRLDS
jgi:drug/metabolite transporter (DMT)-like permease